MNGRTAGRGRRRSPAPGPNPGQDRAPETGEERGPVDSRGRAPDRVRHNLDEKLRGMERIGDLLPRTAREYGLEEQLEQAEVAAAWDRVVAARAPAAAGACRLVAFERGIATVEADLPIVGQEIRLRAPELLAALRSNVRTPVLQLQVTARHV